jgi:adenine-specific DNA-methyltransferase
MITLNYIGSKQTLCPTLINIIKTEITDLKSMSFLDMFAGTGSVGFRFQDLTNNCSANDLEYYSFIINNALLKCSYSSKLQEIINYCNTLDGIDGLIFTNYSKNDNCERMFFTVENARKCDAIRTYIETLKTDNTVQQNEYYFLLASLIVSMDKVANTSCVYGAYLKEYKKSSLKEMIVSPIHTKTNINSYENNVFNMTAEELSKSDIYTDIVYMDPPYNQRQYSANYCPLNYIAYYDNTIVLNGKTGTIDGYNKSNFCSKVRVFEAFKTILNNVKCKYIFISYNNEGLLHYDELIELFGSYGELKLYKIPYKKFKAQKNVSGDTVFEYLWVINKTKSTSNLIEEIIYDAIN